MKCFALSMALACLMFIPGFAAAEGVGAKLISCEYAVYGGMENEDYSYTAAWDDASRAPLLTVSDHGRVRTCSLPDHALDDLAELMAAYAPVNWASLPEREFYALDAPSRRIALTYDDGSEYTLYNDQEAGGPIFADAEAVFIAYMGGNGAPDPD